MRFFLLVLVILAGLGTAASCEDKPTSKGNKSGDVYTLQVNWNHSIECIYGFVYYDGDRRMAPIFSTADRKPLTCQMWKLQQEY